MEEQRGFLEKLKTKKYPLIFAIEYKEYNEEESSTYTASGEYLIGMSANSLDIILEIEEELQERECQFKPFDKVLVRDVDNEEWSVGIYSHYTSDCDYPYFCAGLTAMRQCIPYEGNEHLLGTTDKPKEDRV